MITALLFAAGGVVGYMAGLAHDEALRAAVRETAKKEAEEFGNEIKRLRAQVALHIGK